MSNFRTICRPHTIFSSMASCCWDRVHSRFSLEKATSLALELLNELIGELKVKPCPVVLASFSDGSKACMYRFLQIIEGRCGDSLNLDEYRLVRDCICGHVYDSSPVDFTSD
ncbi:uncharacterized protein LOC124910641 [Impatiens glandulifera]|uniref:uncharacterized protein LOC124910641 n=1 Tax=Impatiens glandulifera TaxID=253017 RepID=UPI001FB05DB5|nr:uncharacterized protein LOC124910641 [Impatiens glandulifera]